MNRSNFNNFFFSPIRLPRREDSNRAPSHTFRSQQVPNQPSGLLARNGFHLDASAGEKIKEQEKVKNRLAVPLNFQAMNISSDIPLESNLILQEDLPAIIPEEAATLPTITIIDANLPPLAQEGPANISVIAAETETPNAAGPASHIFTTNSESVRAENEFETPALWLWDGKDQGVNIPDAVNDVEFLPTQQSPQRRTLRRFPRNKITRPLTMELRMRAPRSRNIWKWLKYMPRKNWGRQWNCGLW
jgi:hypothetical protein